MPCFEFLLLLKRTAFCIAAKVEFLLFLVHKVIGERISALYQTPKNTQALAVDSIVSHVESSGLLRDRTAVSVDVAETMLANSYDPSAYIIVRPEVIIHVSQSSYDRALVCSALAPLP